MSRTASRTLVAALAAVFVLTVAADSAVAQKAKARSGSRSGASSSQVKRVAPPKARSSSPRTVKAAPRSSVRSAPSSSRSTVRVNRATPQARPSTTVRVNRAPAPQDRTRTTVRVNKAPAPQGRSTVRVNKAPTPQERSTVRVNRAPAPDSRTPQTTLKSLYTRKGPVGDPNDNTRDVVRDAQKKKIADQYTQRREDNGSRSNVNRGNDGRRQPYRPGNRSGYNSGHRRGYERGFYDGWHNRYIRRYSYRHYHYYGPHRIWGFHYGGFGFYHSHWHFAIVIGGPVIVYRNYCGYYNYCWWDGRGASLVTWDSAVQAYPASYTFTEGACVELWIRTTAGEDYAVKVDPRYWNARDPGDLYAALWAQLDQEGQLQLEDINGALHVFPAGMIQQIEARACS